MENQEHITLKRTRQDFIETTIKKTKKSMKGKKLSDPSLLYITNPLQAPMVETAKNFFRSKKYSQFIVHVGPINGWRTVAKLAVRGYKSNSNTIGDPQATGRIVANKCIGLFEPGSHEVVPCFDSPVHHPSINSVAKLVEEALILMNATGYREDTDSGLFRYLLFSVQTVTNKVQLTFVINKEVPAQILSSKKMLSMSMNNKSMNEDPLMTTIDWLTKKQKRRDQFHSIWLHYHPASRHNNAITGRLDDSWKCIWGEPMLRECLVIPDKSSGDSESQDSYIPICLKYKPKLCFPPHVFRQANLQGFGRIIMTIRNFVPKKCRCIELYGGVGTIGLNILDLVKKLQCSDENPYNVSCFETTLSDIISDRIISDDLKNIPNESEILATGTDKFPDISDSQQEGINFLTIKEQENHRLNKTLRKRAVYMNSSAKDRAISGDFEHFDLLLVDPPRKGLDTEVIDALLESKSLQRLIYVSCGFKAFTNDYMRIVSTGMWTLVHAEGHVLFPGADHIETLAIFDRVS